MDRKQSALGSYPSNWELVVFDTVAELKHGYQFRTYDFTASGIKIFKITQIKSDGSIDISNCDYIESSRLNDFNKFKIQTGDILMALSGATIGKISRFKSNEVVLQNYRVGNFLTKDNNILQKDYFYYYLTTDYTYQQILANQTQSAQENVGKEDIHKMLIFLPPLPEQKSIAEVLSSLDDKIDLLHRNNKTLEELSETIFKHWLNKLEERESATLGDYIKVQNGYAFKSNDFKDSGNNGVLKITNISFEKVDIQNTQFVDDKVIEGLSDKFLAKPKSFLIAMTGAEIGKIGIIGKTNKKLYINQRVGKLMDIEENSSILGYLFLKSSEGQDHIITTCTGSAQENISTFGLESMPVPKSTKEEVIDICKNINPLFEKIIYNLEQIQQLQLIRDTLLPKLMSGIVRVEN